MVKKRRLHVVTAGKNLSIRLFAKMHQVIATSYSERSDSNGATLSRLLSAPDDSECTWSLSGDENLFNWNSLGPR